MIFLRFRRLNLDISGKRSILLSNIDNTDNKENKLRWGIHYAFVAHIHDEIQALVKPQHVSLYKKLAVDCFRKSGEYFNLKCPLTGEVREGKNWMETH